MTSTMAPKANSEQFEPDHATTPTASWRAWLSNDYAKVLAIVFAWNVVLIGVALLFSPSIPPSQGVPPGIGSTPSLLSHTFRWDSKWYGQIVEFGYDGPMVQARAFYPVFPFSVWLINHVSFGLIGVIAAGFLVNFAATWLAAVALLKIARSYFSDRGSWLVVAAFLTAPTAFFLHSFYSEAIFCALGFWAYLLALRRQWLWMGVVLIPLTATRITAAVFIGLCFLEFWRSKDWKLRGLLSWNLLWFPAAFLGFIAHLAFMKIETGSAFAGFDRAMMDIYWGYHQLNPNIFGTGLAEAKITAHALLGDIPLDEATLVSHVLPFIGLILLFASSVYVFVALRLKGLPLALFGLASLIMLTINSNVVSVHRYLLPCLVMYIALVLIGERRPQLQWLVYVVLYANSLIGGALFLRFISGYWAG